MVYPLSFHEYKQASIRTIFCGPHSNYCTWWSPAHSDCRDCTIVGIVRMKGANCCFSDDRGGEESKDGACLKLYHIDSVLG